MYVFDIEANGLKLEDVTKMHCLVVCNTNTLEYSQFANQKGYASVAEGVEFLKGKEIAGHNVLDYDIPVIQKFYPEFNPQRVRDSLVMSRLIYTDLRDRDFGLVRRNTGFPVKMVGRHGLEAWGYRLGEHKGDYAKLCEEKGIDPWAEWNPDMQKYCLQDVKTNVALFKQLDKANFSNESIDLEHEVFKIIKRQMQKGVYFNTDSATKLYAELVAKRSKLTRELQDFFKPFYKKTPKAFTPKKDNKRYHYVGGAPLCKVELVDFNPGSRDMIADRLIKMYEWKPKRYTDKGAVMVDEAVLRGLKYPPVKLLSEYLLIDKRVGQIAEGNKAWLKYVGDDNRIHGRVMTNGAVTGRMTHLEPNLAQVPAVNAPYGEQCRALFTVPKGKVLVGADASGLELRNLAHYMSRWDSGDYAKIILTGDIHTTNQKAAGLPTRDMAKTFIYGLMYGAGDAKIGSIVKKGASVGKKLKKQFFSQLPALEKLINVVQKRVSKGYLLGLDGRKIRTRAKHAALNTLLQGAGAIIMKRALVILDTLLQEQFTLDQYEFVLNVHDEFQIECDEAIGEQVGQLAVKAIKLAGQWYNYRIEMDGEYKVGKNWAETH